jgi:superfamily II DNA or RNA helicase/diadenosine tetraphosphate (Ap4A) HIT family hydrolase/HKD family nuclease/SOS-response transcriptional repressor LexA
LVVTEFESPFLKLPESAWLCSNDLAFAVFDGYPVSPGHALVITKRVVETWFDASPDEQKAVMDLVSRAREILDSRLNPRPDGYNVGFNAGRSAGQTVPHLHVHVIPRYSGDVVDPRGGVRHVIPGKGNYLHGSGNADGPLALHLSTGHPSDPIWPRIEPRLQGATEIDVLASFVQPSGLDLIQSALFLALRAGARVRILVGDYLYITDPEALRRLLLWMELATEERASGSFEVRLAEINSLQAQPSSFHPKAWRIADQAGGVIVVGSSNISKPALETGIEWNLIGNVAPTEKLHAELLSAFAALWQQSTILTVDVVEGYASLASQSRKLIVQPEAQDISEEPKSPRPWQKKALDSLAQIRAQGFRRALIAVATGLGKTWLAAFDALWLGEQLERRPRVLIVAHRAEILIQAEATFRAALNSRWANTKVSWYLGSASDMRGDLVIASVQKLSRPEGLSALSSQKFDYAVVDEVHHAEAPSYRRVLARLQASFAIGLTATPERTDGLDVARLFDDVLAWQATIGTGIEEGSLVPFRYVGLKDDIDFEQIPWRSGRFDPYTLEEKVENSERMERLWRAWNSETGVRTLVFCCSRRHALFSRDWLRRRGVRAAAVFSGDGGDPRGKSLADLVEGKLEALCVVDLFNEGLDIPKIDRVVMLRPTESKIVFLQQLGRGLRSAEGKLRLTVIDFVGNHRIFASRLLHLFSLGEKAWSWADLDDWLHGKPPELPPGCLIDVELEARDVLQRLLPTGGSAAIEAYRAMRDELQRRPTMTELLHGGYLPSTIRARHGTWFGFVAAEGDLSPSEQQVATSFRDWLAMLEVTALNKSYKMVVLRVLLDNDALWEGMLIEPLAIACRDFLLSHPALRHDLQPTKQFPNHATASVEQWSAWWLEWPLGRWMDDQGGRRWFQQKEGRFVAAFTCSAEARTDFESLTSELVDYRLAQYTRSRLERPEGELANSFTAKVTHSGGRPILMLPSVEELPGRPFGPLDVHLPDGSTWVFRFVRIACNVAGPKGSEGNQLGDLMRRWFGTDAGVPGTGFKVVFQHSAGGWSAAPASAPAVSKRSSPAVLADPIQSKIIELVQLPELSLRFTRYVPVYTLEAAAGLWGPETAPEEAGWTDVSKFRPRPGMFVAKVRGRSMEPKIPDGSWCLFRKCPPGSREGKIILVQFRAMGDVETGGRYTVKKYHSEKTVTEDSWAHQRIQLLALNPEYRPIEVEPQEAEDMIVVGEFVGVL